MKLEAVSQAASLVPSERLLAGSLDATPRLTEAAPAAAPGGISFTDLLGDAVRGANEAVQTAGAKEDALARGTLDDLHGTMIASKEADISIHLVGTIRDKLLDAFQQLWKTSV